MSYSVLAWTTAVLFGVAIRCCADEPVSAVSDVQPVDSLPELKADPLRDEVLSVLAERHVLKLSHAELLDRWKNAEKAWEHKQVQSANQSTIEFLSPDGKPITQSNLALIPQNMRQVAEGAKSTAPVDPIERFHGVFREFSQALPGEPWLQSAKVARVEQQFAANSYIGLGVNTSLEPMQGVLTFQQIIPGGSAERAGLKAGVKVLAIDGWETRGQTINDCIDRIRGPLGTTVTLQIEQEGAVRKIDIRRDFVRIDSMTDGRGRHMRQAHWRHPQDPRIAHIKFQQLVSSTVHELRQVEAEVHRDKCEAAIFDFRQLDRTGDWRHVQLMADALIAGGPLWEEVDREGEVTSVTADTDCLFRSLPLIVMIRGNESGQMRALALALQRTGRAILIEDFSDSRAGRIAPPTAEDTPPQNLILGFPTEVVPVAAGSWMLSVPTRLWRQAANPSQNPGAHYTCRQKTSPDPNIATAARGQKMQKRAGLRANDDAPPIVFDPPVPALEKLDSNDAIDLAMYLARTSLDQGTKP